MLHRRRNARLQDLSKLHPPQHRSRSTPLHHSRIQAHRYQIRHRAVVEATQDREVTSQPGDLIRMVAPRVVIAKMRAASVSPHRSTAQYLGLLGHNSVPEGIQYHHCSSQVTQGHLLSRKVKVTLNILWAQRRELVRRPTLKGRNYVGKSSVTMVEIRRPWEKL
jgi:hypothetical protein